MPNPVATTVVYIAKEGYEAITDSQKEKKEDCWCFGWW